MKCNHKEIDKHKNERIKKYEKIIPPPITPTLKINITNNKWRKPSLINEK